MFTSVNARLVSFLMKTVALESSKVELEIWDTAGQGT